VQLKLAFFIQCDGKLKKKMDKVAKVLYLTEGMHVAVVLMI